MDDKSRMNNSALKDNTFHGAEFDDERPLDVHGQRRAKPEAQNYQEDPLVEMENKLTLTELQLG